MLAKLRLVSITLVKVKHNDPKNGYVYGVKQKNFTVLISENW